jgi:hypothetical protein
MAKARSKKKAKSGSNSKSKSALKKKKPALKAKSAKAVKAKKPAPKKKPAKAKAAPKKLVGTARPPSRIVAKATPPPRATPRSPKKPLAPEVGRALAQAEVDGLISRLPPPVQPVIKTLRRLVLESAPEASELLEDGSPSYFANGVFARIIPSERSVLVKFLRGGHLPSANELVGDGETRTLSLSSLEELKETVLRKLVREAVMLNLSTPVTVQA